MKSAVSPIGGHHFLQISTNENKEKFASFAGEKYSNTKEELLNYLPRAGSPIWTRL